MGGAQFGRSASSAKVSYFGAVEYGFTVNYYSFYSGVQIIQGMKVAGFHLGAGIGFGYSLDEGNYYGFDMPIFAHLSYEFIQKACAPYIAFNVGYLLFGESLIATPSVGLKLNFKNGTGMRIGVGYEPTFMWDVSALTMNIAYTF